MKAQIVITADDVGASPTIDAAVLALLDLGTVTRAAAFSNAPGFASFVKRTKSRHSVVPHLTLTYGCPLGNPEPIKEMLAGTGNFKQPLDYFRGSVTDAISSWFQSSYLRCDERAAALEIERQLRHFSAAYGHSVGACTYHHDVDEMVLESNVRGAPSCFSRGRSGGWRARRSAGAHYDLLDPRATVEDAISSAITIIQAAINRSRSLGGLPAEAVFHPSEDSSDLGSFSTYAEGRVLEYRALQSPQVYEILQTAVRVGDLLVFE